MNGGQRQAILLTENIKTYYSPLNINGRVNTTYSVPREDRIIILTPQMWGGSVLSPRVGTDLVLSHGVRDGSLLFPCGVRGPVISLELKEDPVVSPCDRDET